MESTERNGIPLNFVPRKRVNTYKNSDNFVPRKRVDTYKISAIFVPRRREELSSPGKIPISIILPRERAHTCEKVWASWTWWICFSYLRTRKELADPSFWKFGKFRTSKQGGEYREQNQRNAIPLDFLPRKRVDTYKNCTSKKEGGESWLVVPMGRVAAF